MQIGIEVVFEINFGLTRSFILFLRLFQAVVLGIGYRFLRLVHLRNAARFRRNFELGTLVAIGLPLSMLRVVSLVQLRRFLVVVLVEVLA